jgi:kynurenine formamidase
MKESDQELLTGPWLSLAQPLSESAPSLAGNIRIWADHEVGARYAGTVRVTRIELPSHVGTHIDAPSHVLDTGKPLDRFPISHFMGPGVVLDLPRQGPVEVCAKDLDDSGAEIREGDIVLLSFGYAEQYQLESYFHHPYLSMDAARFFVDRRVKMVGFDTLTPEIPFALRDGEFDFAIHRVLLSNDVLVMENIGGEVARLAGRRVEVVAVPWMIKDSDGAPVVPLARAAWSEHGHSPGLADV